MKAEQVDRALKQKFLTEGNRLVFWDDPEGEFREYVDRGLPEVLTEVIPLDLSSRGGLATKILLERDDPEGQYLLYLPAPRPAAEHDWLLDIRKYSAVFHADVASIWMEELGLNRLALRPYVDSRAIFLRNKKRRRKLARLVDGTETKDELDLKMMAVLAGSEVGILGEILSAMVDDHLDQDGIDLSERPEVLQTLEKMDLASRFWESISDDYGYAAEDPSLGGLLRSLFVSELHTQVGSSIEALSHFELPERGRHNALVTLTQWRDSHTRGDSYDAVANAVAEDLHLSDHLSDLEPAALEDTYTFWEVERRVVANLRDRVMKEQLATDAEDIAEIAARRRAGHWLHGPGKDRPERRAVADAYRAIVAAAELYALKTRYPAGFAFDEPEALLAAYRSELYRFDQLYRQFQVRAATAQREGWNLLKDLAQQVEDLYENGFLQPLGLEWSRLLDDAFLERWRASNMPSQQDFFEAILEPHLDQSDRARAYVIISDAFRYEAGRELTDALNSRFGVAAEIDTMLGVLPSYTALGMASLLPHEEISYSDKGGILVDGKAVAGTAARDSHLAKVGGMACKATELRKMKTDEARAFVGEKRVVYIYHNVIDARGDSASTEEETFEAVSTCIRELANLVKFCINKLNAGKVWVTADHGFLFQQSAPSLTDKTSLTDRPAAALKVKKRYVIGRNLGVVKEAHCGSTEYTARTRASVDYWVPRGANRFHFTGGARFVHGGAMPQEIVIPLVTATRLRGKKREGSKTQKVSVQVLGTGHKITTPVHRFEFIQTEAVSERRPPITLKVAVYEGATPVTSVETLVFESESDSIEERKQTAKLALLSGSYDKSTRYRLVLRDAETEAEVQSIPVVIDRSFESDF